MRLLALTLTLTLTLPARAGLHYSGETVNALPAAWKGFLPDHRTLRSLASPQPAGTLAFDTYSDARDALLAKSRRGPLTADEAADMGALHVRFGQPEKAVELLRPAVRRNPDHFRAVANLGTAWQLAGDLSAAMECLTEAVRLAPAALKSAERAHLKLVQLRAAEGRAAKRPTAVDDLFGVKFAGESGTAEPGVLAAAERAKLPADAVAVVQRLAVWLPADGRLLWHLGELANAAGDVRTAANVLDGCVTEFAMGAADLRARRQLYRTAADRPDHEEVFKPSLTFVSPRPLARAFDVGRLPKIDPTGVNPLPWPALGETTLGKRFRPTYLQYVDDLDGKRVTLLGFMRPPSGAGETFGSFLATEYPIGCWFCDSPDPTGLIAVELAAGRTTGYVRGQVKLDGVLRLNRTDPEAYLFTLTDGKLGVAD